MDENKNYPQNDSFDVNRDYERKSVEEFKVNIDDEVYNTVSNIDIKNQSLKAGKKPDTNTGSIPVQDIGASVYYSEKKSKDLKREHKKRDKIKSIKNRRIFRIVWICMVILVSLSASSYLILGSNDLFAIGREEAATTIVDIPNNTSFEELAEILHEGEIISQPAFFEIYAELTTSAEYTEGGSYEIATNLDYEEIINIIQGGPNNLEVVTITFTEGMNIVDIANSLEENGVIDADEILQAANTENYDNYDMISFIENEEERYYTLEGYMFPDTYDFYKGEDIDVVIGKFLTNFQLKITKETLEEINASGMTLDEVVVLASIIQREAANEEDMLNVSSVLHNRLDFGADYSIFSLDCDSTIFYPYRTRDDVPEDMPDYVSNYDTYSIQGLPAGAIANPGMAAINAAINPNDTDYLYFAHSSDGTPYYAATQEEHNENLITAGLG